MWLTIVTLSRTSGDRLVWRCIRQALGADRFERRMSFGGN